MDPTAKSGAGHLARFGFTAGRTEEMAGPGGLRLWDPAARRPADDDAAALLDTLYFAADPDLRCSSCTGSSRRRGRTCARRS